MKTKMGTTFALFDYINKIRNGLKDRFQTKLLIFLIVSGVQSIDCINVTSFMTSVEQIQTRYGCSYALASWTISSYAVTFSSFIAFFGRAGDILGQREVFLAGIFLVGIFSIIAAVVNNIYVLIVFRALQGVAAAATIPPTYSIVAHTYTGKALSIAIGIISASLSFSFCIGLIIGGAFSASSVGYKGNLWVAAGYSLASFVVGFIFLDSTEEREMKQLDYPGITLFISGAVLLVTGFTEAGNSWKSPAAYVPIVVGFLLIVAFFLLEALFFDGIRAKSVDLMIPKRMWSVTNFKIIPLITFFLFGATFAVILLATEFYQNVSGKSPVLSGVMFGIPGSLTQIIISAVLSTRLVKKLSPKTWCVGGMVVAAVGVLLLTRMKVGDFWRYGFPGTILYQGGCCAYYVNYLSLIMLATPLEMQGLISGICLTMGQFGSSIYIAGLTSILGSTIQRGSSQHQMENKIRDAMYLPLAGFALSAILVLFFVKNLKPEDHQITHTISEESSKEEICDETHVCKNSTASDSLHNIDPGLTNL